MRYFTLFYIISSLFFISCHDKNDNFNKGAIDDLTIFFVNDQHGRIDHFSKIKYIVDQEKQHTNVLLACSVDMFSGNPIVDNYPEKGFPMIDLMNRTGFDVSVLGNHEFDYGESLTLGINDYIPVVNYELFPASGTSKDLTDAETIINYLQANPGPVNYPTCGRYFKFQ